MKIGVNPELMKAQIAGAEADLGMQKAALHAHNARGTEERQFIRGLYETLGLIRGWDPDQNVLERYLSAHKRQYETQRDLMQNQIFKLESQIAIHKAALEEAEKAVVVPRLSM